MARAEAAGGKGGAAHRTAYGSGRPLATDRDEGGPPDPRSEAGTTDGSARSRHQSRTNLSPLAGLADRATQVGFHRKIGHPTDVMSTQGLGDHGTPALDGHEHGADRPASKFGAWRSRPTRSIRPILRPVVETGSRTSMTARADTASEGAISSSSPLRLAPELIVESDWAHVSSRFQALEYDFAVRSTHRGLGEYIDSMFGGCASTGDPTTWYSIIDGLPGEDPFALYIDDRPAIRTSWEPFILKYLTWHINQAAIKASESSYVLLHAAAASHDGIGAIFPAGMEAGKTTLVAGLLREGWKYLTDEAAALDPDSLDIQPFAKPLSIDKGSWEVLADFEPDLDIATSRFVEKQWQVNPGLHFADVHSRAVPAGLVIFPQYSRGAATVIEEIRAVEGLLGAMRQTFDFHLRGRRNLEVLAELVRRAGCYRLTVGDLQSACTAVNTVAGRSG